MSEIGKEWREVLREYIERQQVDPYTYHPDRKPTEFTQPSWHDRLTEERKRLNKEYALNQSCNSVTQQETDNDK
jgi:hypothetical protein